MGANIVLDFHEPAFEEAEVFDRSELAITAAASIANYLIDMKQTVGLLSNGLDAAERVKREEGSQASEEQAGGARAGAAPRGRGPAPARMR